VSLRVMLDNFQTPTMEVCKSCAGAWVGKPMQPSRPMLSNRWRIIVATPWAPRQHHINGPAKSLRVGSLHNHPSCPVVAWVACRMRDHEELSRLARRHARSLATIGYNRCSAVDFWNCRVLAATCGVTAMLPARRHLVNLLLRSGEDACRAVVASSTSGWQRGVATIATKISIDRS